MAIDQKTPDGASPATRVNRYVSGISHSQKLKMLMRVGAADGDASLLMRQPVQDEEQHQDDAVRAEHDGRIRSVGRDVDVGHG